MLRIEFKLRVLNHDHYLLDSKSEHDPFLYIFPSKRINPFSVVYSKIISLKENKESIQWTNVVIETQLNEKLDNETMLKESIGMVLYCRRTIHSDFESYQSCEYDRYVPIAESILFLQDLQSQIDNNKKSLKIIFTDPSAEPPTDSYRLTCEVYIIKLISSGNFSSDSSTGKGYLHYIDPRKKMICDVLYKNKCIQFSSYKDEYIRVLKNQIEPSEMACQSVHVPTWKTILGNLVGPMYSTLLPIHRLDEQYIFYCLSITLDSKDISPDSLLKMIETQLNNTNRYYEYTSSVLAIICESASLFANTCDYLPDLSKKEAAERFTDIQETLSGDCEDMAKHIQIILESWKRGLHYITNPILKAISELLQFYCILLTTTAVTSASASSIREDELGHKSKSNYMCHICTLLIPNEYIIHTLFKDIHSDLKQSFINHFPTPSLQFEKDLPILVCEGTNFVNPLMNQPLYYISNIQEKEYVKRIQKEKEGTRLVFEGKFKMLKRFSVQAQQMNIDHLPSDPSKFCAFYRKVNEVWLDFGFDSFGPVPFAVAYQSSDNIRKPRYGVWFRDLLEKRSDLRFYTMYMLSKDDLIASKEIMDRLQPMRSLAFHPARSPSIIQLEIMQKNKPFFDKLNRLADLSISKKQEQEHDRHHMISPHYIYYCNHINKITPKMLNDMEELIKSANTYGIKEFKFLVHPLSDDGELYLLEFRFMR